MTVHLWLKALIHVNEYCCVGGILELAMGELGRYIRIYSWERLLGKTRYNNDLVGGRGGQDS